MDYQNKFPMVFSEFYRACRPSQGFEFSVREKGLNSFRLHKLTEQENEMLKMFVWFEMYVHLSNTLIVGHKEDVMFKPTLIRTLLIELIKEDSTLEGIEYTTRVPLEVLEDILYGINPNPSLGTAVTIIEYYIIIKRHEYTEFLRRISQWTQYHYFSK